MSEDEDRPKYFHLLSDREIRALRPMLELLRDHREDVLDRWYELYVSHFGNAVTLSAPAFRDLYGRDLEALVRNLLEGDMEGFEADMRALGRNLMEHGVPFAEVVASLHLFEESSSEQFQKRLEVVVKGKSIYPTFDKLSHCRMIVLSTSYFAGQAAVTSARLSALEAEATRLTGGPRNRSHFHGLVGSSAVMRCVYEQIAAVSGGRGTVLIAGETGTGKELVARAIHERSGKSERPFIAVNCAALPRELIESELFGHRKGAYTGAAGEYAGLIRSASGGTLFLDEVTETALETQAKLLRVLEQGAVRPVGASNEIPVDVRFVASTNRDPDKAVEAGLLRRDLFYRLAVHRISVPPLRDRIEDVPRLAAHFCSILAGFGLRTVDRFEDEALTTLQGYTWPGNVRELRSAIEHALTLGKGNQIVKSDLPPHVVRGARPVAERRMEDEGARAIPTIEEAEHELIVRALDATGGNRLRAARMLGISRHRLYDRLRKYGLD